jgi:uncharacterized protein
LIAAVLALAALAAPASAEAFDASGSVEQVYATEIAPGAQVELLDAGNQVVGDRNANSLGGVVFRNVTPGSGYRVRVGGETSAPLTVMTTQSAPSDPAVHEQELEEDGYGYMSMRDGTKLAYSVHPPTDVLGVIGLPLPPELLDLFGSLPLPGEEAPTLVEYSGYGYANPAGPESGIAALANLMGFTVVDVNMRGTGCSGGSFDFFEPLQNLDGYDVVETVARQPWVKGDKVGMLGISYGGISQLFTAQTQPPSLSAITPISVLDQVQTTLYPGGILNTGFAFNWAQERAHEAQAAGPDSGQPWAWERIQGGDQTCAENQALHPEAPDLIQKVRDNDHYVPEVADPLSPITFVDKIEVPVFMACQWTDEQTGGHCPTLASRMTGTDKKWFTFTNGTHVDSLSPEVFNRLYDFLKIYVAEQSPATAPETAILQVAAPLIFETAFGISGVTLPPDPVRQGLTLEAAKAAFEAQPPVRILYDNGAGPGKPPGHPYPAYERSYETFPIPGTEARSWYLAPGGTLADQSPAEAAADGFTWDLESRPPTNFTGDTGTGDLWTETPNYQWSQDPPGSAVAYATEPLSADTTVAGAGGVDIWVRSSQPNVDLQATISEIRPDGKETFVQGGWVRGDARRLDEAKSTPLQPVLSLREEHVEPLPSDRFVKVTVPLYYQGHMYRSGSRIRVRISAPNGDQPIWAFAEAEPAGQAHVAIGYGAGMPSRLVLPVVPGDAAPTGLPPCPGLRGEPCRDYVPFTNAAAPVGTPAPGVAKKCVVKKKRKKGAAKKAEAAGKQKGKKRKKKRCVKKQRKRKRKK